MFINKLDESRFDLIIAEKQQKDVCSDIVHFIK